MYTGFLANVSEVSDRVNQAKMVASSGPREVVGEVEKLRRKVDSSLSSGER